MSYEYFKKVDFEAYKDFLGLRKRLDEDWKEEDNGVLVKPFISEEESKSLDITYIGLKFKEPTDGHFYKTQTDTIKFVTDGKVEFFKDYIINRKIKNGVKIGEGKEKSQVKFPAGSSAKIVPPVVRKLFPCEIELIVQPRFNSEDEVHVYD